MTAAGRLTVELVRSALAGDAAAVRRAAGWLAQHERSKKSGGIASDLDRLLGPENQARLAEEAAKYCDERQPRALLSGLVLPTDVRSIVEDLTVEHQRTAELAAAGLEPRSRVLLAGAPGTGKTSLAEGLAAELGLPFVVADPVRIADDLMGRTAKALAKVLEYTAAKPCLLFLDEAETLLKERTDNQDIGEMKRVGAALLVRLERLPPTTTVVAATNHPELLDRAAARRFHIRLELPTPDAAALRAYVARRWRSRNVTASIPEPLVRRAALQLAGCSYADAEQLADDVARRRLLHPGETASRSVDAATARFRIGHEAITTTP